jgi:tetratricopeptide (TPR) repeat protein
MIQDSRVRSRVVEIYVRRDRAGRGGPGRDHGVATGYAVADDLVLTAGHVLDTCDTGTRTVQLRRLGDQGWIESGITVRWHRCDDQVDAALLQVAGAPWAGLPDSGAIRWGTPRPDDAVPCFAIGFPQAQERPDLIRDTESASGRLSPNTRVKSGGLVVDLGSAAPSDAGSPEHSPWSGMSGAALLSAGARRILGVVTRDIANFGHRRLEATPASVLLSDPGFAAAVGQPRAEPVTAGGHPPIDHQALREPYVPLPQRHAESQLLAAKHGVVPFQGRGAELGELTTWCRGGPRLSIAVLTGSAGSGKSRLAAELCAQMRREHGWDAFFAAPGGSTWARIDPDWPLLLVFDYPEQMVPELAMVVSQLANRLGRCPKARLLLVSRQSGPWYIDVDTETDGILSAATDLRIPLADVEFTLADRTSHAAAAMAAFAAHLGVPCPAPPDVTGPAYQSPLLVHMAALLTVHGDPVAHPDPGHLPDKLLDGLLNRERRRWRQQAVPPGAGAGSGLASTLAHQAVTLATLTGPKRTECRDLLRAVPELADAPAERRGQIADWLGWLYPAGHSDNGIAPLQPDLAAGRLLATTPELAALACRIAGLPACTATHTLTMLQTLRLAADHEPAAHAALHELLATQLQPILHTAVQARADGVLRLAGDCLRLFGPADPQLAEAAAAPGLRANFLPTRLSRTLAELTVAHCRTRAATDPDGRGDLAAALHDLGSLLISSREHRQALPLLREAERITRDLAAADPGTHRPHLASALQNLANALNQTGAAAEALAASEEAVAIVTELFNADPMAYRSLLPNMVKDLAQDLSAVGRHDHAIAAAEQAIAMAATLGLAPAEYELFRANSQVSLAVVLARAGRKADALAVSRETVEYLHSVIGHQERVRPALVDSLAHALNNLSADLTDAGDTNGAAAAMRESVAMYEWLAASDPDGYASALVTALENLDQRLLATGRAQDPAEAAEAAQRRVDLGRLLVADQSGDHRDALADSLVTLGVRRRRTGGLAAAIPAAEEAVGIYRELAAESTGRYRPRLALALHYLCGYRTSLGDLTGAVQAGREAVQIRRDLCASGVDEQHRIDLVASLANLSSAYIQLGEPALAETTSREALDELPAGHPERHQAELASALNALGIALAGAGPGAGARDCFTDALAIRRRLAAASPPDHELDLAQSLHNLGTTLLAEDPVASAAIPLLKEALAIFIGQVADGNAAARPNLLGTWQALGWILLHTGQRGVLAFWAGRVAAVMSVDDLLAAGVPNPDGEAAGPGRPPGARPV